LLTHEGLCRHARLITVAWVAYWVLLTGLLHSPRLPSSPIPLDARAMVAHFVAFALLTLGCVLSARARMGAPTYRWLGTWLVVFVVYAGLSELLQPLTNRDGDVWDWLANVAGVVVVMALARPRARYAAQT